MRKIKMQNGITLIALIITIIVLLILAGVAIASVKDSGIIGKAKEAVEKHEAGKSDEESKLQGYEDFLESYMSGQQGGGDIVTPPLEDGGENPPPQTGMPKATVGIKVEQNSTIDGKAYSSANPIIPAGFTAINTGTSNWNVATGPEVDNGLVIRDEAGNEFVWVPVADDISTTQYTVTISDKTCREPDVVTGSDGISYDAVVENLQRAQCAENPDDSDEVLTSDDFKVELTNMYKSMAESLNKYDGFYVGRFETSKNGTNPQSKASTADNVVTSATNAVDSANTWYGLYALNKKYSTSSVQGSMIWGIQYDKMMTWMGDAVNTTISGRNTARTCGTAPDDVIKNVYDLYGNSFEWTIEATDTFLRVLRGRLLQQELFTKLL